MRSGLIACAAMIGLALGAVLVGGATGEKATAQGGAKVGEAAPDFNLKDQNGKAVKLSDLKGKIVVLEWFNPNCPFVQRHYESGTFTRMNDKYAAKDVVHLAVNSIAGSTPAQNKKFAEAHALKYSILDDSEGVVGKAYGARSTPHLFVIDKAGKLAYAGAVDDDPNGNKTERVNYVENALNELLDGKEVSRKETKSYGCGIHYKD